MKQRPGSFTSGDLTFETGSTVCLFHCKVWVSNDKHAPVEYFMSGLFELDEYMMSDRSAGIFESGWFIFPKRMDDVYVEGSEPITIYDEEGLCLFVSMDDLWPQLDPAGYASMLRQERDMEMWAEQEENDRKKRERCDDYYDCGISDITGKEMQ